LLALLLHRLSPPAIIPIDISFEGPNHGGIASSLLIRYLTKPGAPYAHAVPLTLVLKSLFSQRGLNQPWGGGLSSYALMLMVIAILQQFETPDVAQANAAAIARSVEAVKRELGFVPTLDYSRALRNGTSPRACMAMAAAKSHASFLGLGLGTTSGSGNGKAPPPPPLMLLVPPAAGRVPGPPTTADALSLRIWGQLMAAQPSPPPLPLPACSGACSVSSSASSTAGSTPSSRSSSSSSSPSSSSTAEDVAALPPLVLTTTFSSGFLLTYFLEYYGRIFNPAAEGLAVDRGFGLPFPLAEYMLAKGVPAADPLTILDPLDAAVNVSRCCFRIGEIQWIMNQCLATLEARGVEMAREEGDDGNVLGLILSC
jgi:hypothetical protein